MSKIKIFALGGLNEAGKNIYVVEVDQDIFVLDAGLRYADDKMLGIDYILPNYDYLKTNEKRIKGLFLTHGHDEQMGAVSDILEELPNLNIYGTDFTIEILKTDLQGKKANLHVIEPHRSIKFGNVSVFPISLTHSVPRSVGYVINTKDGAIVYTGNFVFDQRMLGAYKMDIGKLAYVGKQGVLCLLSESKYAEKLGYTSPNNHIGSIIRENIEDVDGRILINIFQAQFYRIQEILEQIEAVDKKVVILGKTLENLIRKAIELGYMQFDVKRILGLSHINDDAIIVLISDEREKPFSNMSRIIKGYDKFVKLTPEDKVIFATPVYEGMEKSATRIYDDVAKLGADIFILSSKKYLGNHASSEDLMMMLNLMNPKYYMPVIGEYRHQVANANNARKVGLKDDQILLRLNGQVTTFIDGKLVETGETVNVDEILVDGKTVGDVGEMVVKDREILSDNGIVIVSATIDKQTKKVVAGPEIATRGFIYVKDNIDLMKEAKNLASTVILENIKDNYVDFNKIKTGIREKLGKYFYKQTECKPMILIVIQEVVI